MKLRHKKTGREINVRDAVVERLIHTGDYEYANPVKQPEIREVPKKKKKKSEVVIQDLADLSKHMEDIDEPKEDIDNG